MKSNKIFNKIICFSISALVIIQLLGCGARLREVVTPTPMYEPSDNGMDCKYIKAKLTDLQNQQKEMKTKVSLQRTFNVVNGIAGCFTILNWFLIDPSNDQSVALRSIEERINYLKAEAVKMQCPIEEIKTDVPNPKKSSEEDLSKDKSGYYRPGNH